MTQKSAKNDELNRATLADIVKEMAKPRLAESVREAAEIAEAEATHVRRMHKPGKSRD